MDVNDLWGIGKKITNHLKLQGIQTTYQLSMQCPKAMRTQFSVLIERTVNELNGVSCLLWDDIKTPKREIFSTRSFGKRIVDINTLKAPLTTHGSIVAKKVRNQSSLVKKLMVFASSSPHDDNYYKQAMVYKFPVATDNSCDIANSNAISEVLNDIFVNGVRFYRCGVGAIELTSRTFQQPDLFLPDNSNPLLMNCLDNINHRYGQGTLTSGAKGVTDTWQMKRHFLMPKIYNKLAGYT